MGTRPRWRVRRRLVLDDLRKVKEVTALALAEFLTPGARPSRRPAGAGRRRPAIDAGRPARRSPA